MYGVGVTTSEAQSIASILSGKLRVKIAEGQRWAYDFEKKTINYVAEDLKNLTSVDLIGNLLHEAGHAKYSADPAKLEYPGGVLKKHRDKLFLLVNAIEDFRIEDLMRAFYPYATDYLPEYSFKTKYALELLQDRYIQSGRKVPKFIQYCYSIYAEIAGFGTIGEARDVRKVVNKTINIAIGARWAASNQAVAEIIAIDIYPHVKHWLEYDEIPEPRPVLVSSSSGRKPKYPTYDKLYSEIRPLIRPTTEKFNRILTDNIFDKFAGKYRTGPQLMGHKLYRHQTGDYRLFQRKVDAKAKEYVFALLVDESGSMRVDRVINAVKGAILFAHVLNNLKIPFGIYGFNSKYKKYKGPFDAFTPKHFTKFETMMKNTLKDEAGWNNDPEAVFRTSEDLLSFKGKKVLIVLSDGEPAPEGNSAIEYPDLEEQVQIATRKGVEAVGVGIQTPAVKEYYKTHAIVNNIEELPNTIVSVLKSKLRN